MTRSSTRSTFACTECGWHTVKWVGRCAECHTWGSVEHQAVPDGSGVRTHTPVSKAVPISEVTAELTERDSTGIVELDRVLGGGVVPGAVILLVGEPGVGKSTLLLDVAARWAGAGRRALYLTGEESAGQVRLRAGRMGTLANELFLAAETDLGTVLGHIRDVKPSLLVLDSVQTISAADLDGAPGGVTQTRETTGALVRAAKRSGMAVIIVGHVTKDGTIAGPRTMEHLVDVVLTFEGDRHSGFRLVRTTKNRFGPSDEVGCFELVDHGIVEVTDPSGLFTSRHAETVPGTCLTVVMEGRRPMLTEIQALVAPSLSQQYPRRITHGIENGRVTMLTAVLERRARLRLTDRDVYSATVGGARILDPAADLACALAIASAASDSPVASSGSVGRIVAIGEVGLAGELRAVPALERRIAEAARLGIDTAVVPTQRESLSPQTMARGVRIIECSTLPHALAEVLSPRSDA